MNKFAASVLMVTAVGGGICQSAGAGEVTGLTVFVPNTPAKAAEVNKNFDAVTVAVKDNSTRVGALETLTSGQGGDIAGLKTEVAGKAVAADVNATLTALQTSVNGKIDTVQATAFINGLQQGVNGKASQTDFNALKADVAGKAVAADVTATFTALQATVNSKMDTVTANTQISAVQQGVNSKAPLADFNTLKNDVTALTTVVAGKAVAATVTATFTAMQATVNSKMDTVTANTQFSTLQQSVNGKAALVDFNTLKTDVVSKAADATASFTALQTAVNGKMDTATANTQFSALQQGVNGKASQTDFNALQQSVNGKVSQTDFNALKTQVAGATGMLASIAYQKTPEYAGVTLSNAKINGGSIIAPVAPGSSILVTLDYAIVDTTCPGCIDQIQIGFSHEATAAGCVYNGVPGASGVSGSNQIALTAPQQPGVYFIGFDRSQQYFCQSDWWTGAPSSFNRYLAVVVVQ